MEHKPRRRSLFPKTLDECIQPVTRPAFAQKGLAGSRIISDWQKIAGPHMASHCTPQKVSFPRDKTTEGTLTIAVEPGFAPQLQHMQPLLLEKLAVYFGYRAIDRIRISHTLAPAVKPTAPRPEKKSDRHGITTLPNDLLDTVEDVELQAALQSFATTLKRDPL
ncbi:MAG: DUF721 domain-containing protein [Alphaproteobacteria bacterium]